jgi:hypothetical protein
VPQPVQSAGALTSVDALPPGPDLVEIADLCKVVKNAYDQGNSLRCHLGTSRTRRTAGTLLHVSKAHRVRHGCRDRDAWDAPLQEWQRCSSRRNNDDIVSILEIFPGADASIVALAAVQFSVDQEVLEQARGTFLQERRGVHTACNFRQALSGTEVQL